MMDKRNIGGVFRERLALIIERYQGSQARFAESIGLDRSALSQLLATGSKRLPRAETLARLAAVHSVSLDWLLGLSQSDRLVTEITPTVEIEELQPGEEDTELARWHGEAAGAKIRYVPATIPDRLRTTAVVHYEHIRGRGSAPQAPGPRRSDSDMEVSMPRQTLELLAAGAGVWSGLERAARREQLITMARLLDELYPSYRLFLFDGQQVFSAPYTVFGQIRVAIYVGDMYLVVSSVEHIRAFTGHFDDLIRHAEIGAHEVAGWIERLAAGV